MPVFWLISLIAIISMIAYIIIWTIVNNAKPKTSVSVQVVAIDKRDSGHMIRSGLKFYVNFTRVYYVTFAFIPEGKTKKFTVPVSGNESITVGSKGILTRQGARFISFARKSKRYMDRNADILR